MKKRNIKYIKLIAGSLAVTSMFSACARNTRETAAPQVVYVYVTATPTPSPTPTPVIETTTTTPSVQETTPLDNGYWAEDSYLIWGDTSSNTEQTEYTGDGYWAEDGAWLFYSDNNSNTTTPTAQTTVDEYWALSDEEEMFWSNLNNGLATINETIDNFSFEQARESAVNEAGEVIDFIFYGAEMNGTTFEELTDRGRQEVYSRLQALDARIMQFYPDYKTDLGELYNKVRDFLSTAYENAREAFGSNIRINIEINPTESTMNAPRERKDLKTKKIELQM